MRCILAFLCSSFFSSAAFAAYEYDTFAYKPWIFLGVDGGYSTQSTDVATEINKDGYHLDVKGLVSYSWRQIMLDGGVGYLYNSMDGDSSGTTQSESIKTNAVFFEISPRYRVTERFSFGPMAQFLLGQDVGFNVTGEKKNTNMFVGAQAAYRFMEEIPVNVTLSGLTDVMMSDRQQFMILAGVQIGFPFFFWRTTEEYQAPAAVTPAPQPREEVVRKVVTEIVKVEEKKTVLALTYQLDLVRFKVNKFELDQRSKKFFEEVGEYLSEHPKMWKAVRVEGHTDKSGSAAYNMKLSQKRAASVKSALLKGGAEASKITAEGFGLTRPIMDENSAEAARNNRRVELIFEDVKEPEPFKAEISKIQKRVLGKN